MRIAILNWSNRRIGGTGTYLSAVVPALERAGHDLALWHEVDTPIDYDTIPMPSDAPVWSMRDLGLEPALAALQSWRPDLLYAHGLLDTSVEQRTLQIAPSVFFAHNYYGTCISGTKTLRRPVATPCTRTFGWQCLAHYYPSRCGGWNPVTMVRQYRQQQARLQLLSRYAAVVTHSRHMQQELTNHGLDPVRVFDFSCHGEAPNRGRVHERHPRSGHEPWQLLFVGRMDELKGGRQLIQALPEVVRRLDCPIHLTLAGDGPERRNWESLASELSAVEPRARVSFPGWLERLAVNELFSRSDLLVVPSLWPEPLALVGLEAAQHSLPVAAYAVGGVSDWLTSGRNGFLAPGNPPTVEGLAHAIGLCLEDPATHARLKDGAAQISADMAFEKHIDLLLRAFTDVTASPPHHRN